MKATNPWGFRGSRDMHLVFCCSLNWCECNQTRAISRVGRNSSFVVCSVIWRGCIQALRIHRVRCILFFAVALFGVSAAKPWEFVGFGEMHPICCCLLYWLECNQTIGSPRARWDASVFCVVALTCMNAANSLEFPGFGEMRPALILNLSGYFPKPVEWIAAAIYSARNS